MSKLLFFDIDGTLIDFTKGIYSIPESTRKTLRYLQDHGHHVFLATGRCHCFILDGVMDYPFSGYVTCNGGYAEYQGQPVFKKAVPTEAIKLTHQLSEERDLVYYFESRDYICVRDKKNKKHIEFAESWGMKEQTTIDQYCFDEVETYIGMIAVNTLEDAEIVKKVLSPYFDVQQHMSGLSFDLTLKNVSKAKGIEAITEYLGMKTEDTIAFGDGRNDIEMLSRVGLGIAMGNAANEAKEVAKYVTDDVDRYGIEKALIHFGLLPKDWLDVI